MIFRVSATGLVLACSMFVACEHAPPATADPSTTTASTTQAPVATTTAAPSAIASTSASVDASDGSPPLVDVKGNEVGVSSAQWTNGARYDVPAKAGNDVTLQLVEYVAAPSEGWKVVRADPVLGKPKEKMVPAWWGPPTTGHLFTWSTKGVAPGAYEIVMTLAGASDPMTITFVVRVS